MNPQGRWPKNLSTPHADAKPSGIRVLIVDTRSEYTAKLEKALRETGFIVVDVVPDDEHLPRCVRELRPEAIVIDSESPTRDTLEGVAALGQRDSCPIVVLSERGGASLVREAMQLGISAYVVDGVPPATIRSLIEVAMVHFRSQCLLLAELESTQQKMEEQRLIDRAKFALMEREQMSEHDAYHWLRRRAMTRGQKTVDAARMLLQAMGIESELGAGLA